ncbi:hypothetical protein FG379_001734 [Cryptosporidium bovis]|uniref:uncharacterized protein n=1 Tax=Cryptosporidium bovis TaxID=310047 RepID=UPI00351A441F|nr:hypothetical protein FG379_001734 [Cryptosporidium bovis]
MGGLTNNGTKRGIQVYDDRLHKCDDTEALHARTLLYLFLSLGALKTEGCRRLPNEYKAFEIFVIVKKRDLVTGIIKDIGKEPIYPVNYCTPFESSKIYIYFNFNSVDNIVDYLEKNELTFDLCFSRDNLNINLLSNERINDIISPMNDIEKNYNISNSENGFKTCLILKLEWCIARSNKIQDFGLGLNHLHRTKIEMSGVCNYNLKGSANSVKMNYKTALWLPEKLYFIYEDMIFYDPINSLAYESQTTKRSNVPMNGGSSLQRELREETLSRNHEKFGGWKIKLTSISLKEEGFIHIYDRFPKHYGQKSFKVFLQHCIKNKDGENLTPYRGSWSILTLRRTRNSINTGDFSYSKLYSSNLNIYSRITEVFFEDISDKYFFVKCTVSSTLSDGTENSVGDLDVLFVGRLNLSGLINKKVIVKLYKNLSSRISIGYINLELNDIGHKTYIPKTDDLSSTSPIHNLCVFKKRINVNNILDELSLLFFYIYLHVEMRSKVEDKNPKDILEELYFRVTKSLKHSYLNMANISKFIEAFIPPDHYFLGCLTELVEKTNDEAIMIETNEILNQLLFPHLVLLKKIYKHIFTGSTHLERTQFTRICNSLGVRESFAVAWFEMMRRNSDKGVSIESYIYCIDHYRVRNIFK